jgi:RNA polymerase primary sigma factor
MEELDEKQALYIKEMNDLPLLTFEREKELSKIIQGRIALYAHIKDDEKRLKAEQKDSVLRKAIDEIVTYNLRLVIKEAFKFSKNTGVDIKDLIGSGNIGLVKAASLYDSDKYNNRFSTYATYWIRQSLFETVHASGPVKVPTHILNGRYRHNKLTENGITNEQDIMDELEVNEIQFKRIKNANISVVSLDQNIDNGSGDDKVTTVADLMADEKAVDPSDGAASQDQYNYLYDALSELDEMSRDIVSAQILSHDKIQLSELGKKYGKTGERIRQIRDKALDSLRKKIEYKTKFGK